MELELGSEYQEDRIEFRTQVEISVTTADFYFPVEPRPLLVVIDGRVHHGQRQTLKDEGTRSLLRKKGYRVLELYYDCYFDKKRDKSYEQIQDKLVGLCVCVSLDQTRLGPHREIAPDTTFIRGFEL